MAHQLMINSKRFLGDFLIDFELCRPRFINFTQWLTGMISIAFLLTWGCFFVQDNLSKSGGHTI